MLVAVLIVTLILLPANMGKMMTKSKFSQVFLLASREVWLVESPIKKSRRVRILIKKIIVSYNPFIS